MINKFMRGEVPLDYQEKAEEDEEEACLQPFSALFVSKSRENSIFRRMLYGNLILFYVCGMFSCLFVCLFVDFGIRKCGFIILFPSRLDPFVFAMGLK